MTDTSSPPRTTFSQQDRLYITKTVSALVPVQFNELVFSLSPPPGVVPDQGDRTHALLQWVESPTGPGLEAIEDYLQSVIPKYARISQHFMTITLPVDYASLTDEQKNQLAQRITEILGVTVDLFEVGSVKIIVSGSENA
ncbi:MAG: hypothetical protein V2I45_12725, partial [Halieaceae bacterium]|nr:hypothetical protein [Halieaceae bacterium]